VTLRVVVSGQMSKQQISMSVATSCPAAGTHESSDAQEAMNVAAQRFSLPAWFADVCKK
jgi:hypothetical protein